MSNESGQTALEESVTIRQELKDWEKQFAAANDGRKAGREDIKKNPAIASKYKEYERLRNIISGKAPTSQASQAAKKRKTSHKEAHTPSRKPPEKGPPTTANQASTETPSKPKHPASLAPYDTPASARKFSTPSHQRTFIGPTPQKDGLALGLFDLLSDNTPSKDERRTTLGGVTPNAQLNTPSKAQISKEVEVEVSGGGRRSRTPTSTGKRFLLDSFATPMKRKRLNNQGGETPSSVSKLHFSTPAFLRRDSQRLGIVNEEGELSPVTRMPKKPPIRGLSSMLAGLRKMEDEKLDEDMEIMREMEMGGVDTSTNVPKVLVGDSQAIVVPGEAGFASDSEDEGEKQEGLGRDGKPLKVWKKKGQKRTTRRVIMRPVLSKPKPPPEALPLSDSDDDLAVPETQLDTTAPTQAPEHYNEALQLEPEAAGSDADGNDNSDSSHQPHPTKKRNPTSKLKAEKVPKTIDVSSKKEGPVKKAAKKISAQAHANFRRLNIKNKNSKGKGGGGRRGGRRR